MVMNPASGMGDTQGGGSAGSAPSMIQSRRALYVGGLADSVTETILRSALIPFGPIKSIDVPRDYAKGTHKGFAFVEYEDPEDAAEAIYNMDGAELLGRVLSVNLAQANRHKLGSHKAVWSTDEWFQEQSVNQEEEKAKETDANTDVSALKEKSASST